MLNGWPASALCWAICPPSEGLHRALPFPAEQCAECALGCAKLEWPARSGVNRDGGT